MTHPSAIVFDMDGVLVDTEPISRGVLEDIYLGLGQRVSNDLLDAIVGVRVDDAIDMLSAAYPNSAGPDEIFSAYELAYLPRLASCKLFPGVRSLLIASKAQGIGIGLASSASRSEIDVVLTATGLGSLFDTVRSGEDVAQPKPDPEIYLAALDDLGVNPSHAIAIEDSPFGIASAVGAGMYCVAVRNANAPRLDLALVQQAVPAGCGPSLVVSFFNGDPAADEY
jgi:HAD superfamily hydrolase (TIGR01509 family)